VLSSVLKQGVVPVMDYDMCRALDGYHDWLTHNMMCAGKWEGGVDACQVHTRFCLSVGTK